MLQNDSSTMVIGEGVAVGKTENKREVRVSRAEPPEPLSEPPQSNMVELYGSSIYRPVTD